ncbi:hypothetical protein PtA15_15A133 [Puccinia triticina]|uniref:CxC6 like cysteine cluster associated with KDZ domain-containing protein n=1 Tax=Puccinia triticina TaxID=208348 RepID=A0ABY7D642_9BASI|nr:uncharacterized protein PtA15_15A133 [Puccinia triticina]WAQ91742.1 hypothetical protein PtA15_15A133 [Puccinia triticina]
MPMYACPHLATCGDLKYNKKACNSHSRLSGTAVKRHTLNRKIHGNCGPKCPAYKLNVPTNLQYAKGLRRPQAACHWKRLKNHGYCWELELGLGQSRMAS